MKLGINQPYFFPYIGYWQLINAVDEFLLFDDVQYIRHGWINRNRILKEGGWTYITLPLTKHSRDSKIKDVEVSDKIELRSHILNHLVIYRNKAPFFLEIFDLIDRITSGITTRNIVEVNASILEGFMKSLGIKTKLGVCSKKGFDYSQVRERGDWPIVISKQMNASEYINPISGKELYNSKKFESARIKLSFIRPRNIAYAQFYARFEPDLSIIDVMMFNGIEGTKRLLNEYDVL